MEINNYCECKKTPSKELNGGDTIKVDDEYHLIGIWYASLTKHMINLRTGYSTHLNPDLYYEKVKIVGAVKDV